MSLSHRQVIVFVRKKRERGYTPYRTEVDACLLFFFAAKNDEHNKSIKIIKGKKRLDKFCPPSAVNVSKNNNKKWEKRSYYSNVLASRSVMAIEDYSKTIQFREDEETNN